MHSWRFIIFVLLFFTSLPVNAQNALGEYVKKATLTIDHSFWETGCLIETCDRQKLLRNLHFDTELARPAKDLWSALAAYPSEKRGEIWLQSIYAEIDVVVDQLSLKDLYGDEMFKWLIVRHAVEALRLNKTDPAYLYLISEVQLRAFMALQFEEVLTIYRQVKASSPASLLEKTLGGARLRLMYARVLIFMGQIPRAYNEILRVIKSEAFLSPEMAYSPAYLIERQWAWFILRQASSGSTRQTVDNIARSYIPASLTQHPRNHAIEDLLMWNPKRLKGFRLRDSLTKEAWKILRWKDEKTEVNGRELRHQEEELSKSSLGEVLFVEIREAIK